MLAIFFLWRGLSGTVDAVLIYDGGCGLCAFGKNLVMALDWRRRIRPVALQDPESARFLAAMEEGQRWASFHVVADGKTASRGEGLLQVLGVLPIGRGIPRLAAEVPAFLTLSERAYSFFHALRDRLQCAV